MPRAATAAALPEPVERPTVERPPEEAREAAAAAGLRYVSDDRPGISRRRRGRGFVYLTPAGEPIRDPEERRRIEGLAIPPAWTEVWICPNPRGHIQATGRDARGRKQYRYHARWREVRDTTKFFRTIELAEALPALRDRVRRDLRRRGLPREKVLATVVRLLETTCIRVGNDEYRKSNGTFGLTTLRNRHVAVRGGRLFFRFRAKGGVERRIALSDRSLARIVRECQEIPGYELFQYLERGQPRTVDSADVNDYLREITGQPFTAKDFRTWMGTVHAWSHMRSLLAAAGDRRPSKKDLLAVLDHVAGQLCNTRSVCRQFYVHPGLQEAFLEGALNSLLTGDVAADSPTPGLSTDEAAVLAFLRAHRPAPA